MQGYFTKKKKKTNLDLLSIPRLWGGGTNTEYTGSLGYNSVFRVCYITSIDDVDVMYRDTKGVLLKKKVKMYVFL